MYFCIRIFLLYNKLDRYKELLIEWNKKFNLTTIIEEKGDEHIPEMNIVEKYQLTIVLFQLIIKEMVVKCVQKIII